jgi:hypothetical protein
MSSNTAQRKRIKKEKKKETKRKRNQYPLLNFSSLYLSSLRFVGVEYGTKKKKKNKEEKDKN